MDGFEEWHLPGISIGVVDGDGFWAEGYGIASFPDTPVTPSTLFYDASTTKAFTSAALALPIHDPINFTSLSGKTPVSSLVPLDFVLEDEWATSHLIIEDILSHRTGMPRHDLSYGGYHEGRNATPEDIVRALRYLPMTEEPRSDSTTAPGLIFRQAVAAEFKVGSDGVTNGFGIAIEPEMGLEGRFWFEIV